MTFKLHTIVKINNNLFNWIFVPIETLHILARKIFLYSHIFKNLYWTIGSGKIRLKKIISTEYLWVFFQIWAENRIHLQ